MTWKSWGWGLGALACLATGSTIPAASTRTSPAETSNWRESQLRNLDIEFYRQRVARDPRSARDYAQLGGLYLQRARETADNEDLLRAEWNARHSLRLRTGRNAAAFGVLASSLMAQHRFVEARKFAERLLASDSSSVALNSRTATSAAEAGVANNRKLSRAAAANFTRRPYPVTPNSSLIASAIGPPGRGRRTPSTKTSTCSSQNATSPAISTVESPQAEKNR